MLFYSSLLFGLFLISAYFSNQLLEYSLLGTSHTLNSGQNHIFRAHSIINFNQTNKTFEHGYWIECKTNLIFENFYEDGIYMGGGSNTYPTTISVFKVNQTSDIQCDRSDGNNQKGYLVDTIDAEIPFTFYIYNFYRNYSVYNCGPSYLNITCWF